MPQKQNKVLKFLQTSWLTFTVKWNPNIINTLAWPQHESVSYWHSDILNAFAYWKCCKICCNFQPIIWRRGALHVFKLSSQSVDPLMQVTIFPEWFLCIFWPVNNYKHCAGAVPDPELFAELCSFFQRTIKSKWKKLEGSFPQKVKHLPNINCRSCEKQVWPIILKSLCVNSEVTQQALMGLTFIKFSLSHRRF